MSLISTYLLILFFTSPVGMLIFIIACAMGPSRGKRRKSPPWALKNAVGLSAKQYAKEMKRSKRLYYRKKIKNFFK